MRNLRSLAIALAVVVLLRAAWRSEQPRFRPLDDRKLAQISGQSTTLLMVSDNCARYSLGAGQVAGSSCAGNDGSTCILCNPGGNFNSALVVDSGGGAIQAGTAACAAATKKVGTCNGGVCSSPVQMGFCSGDPPAYVTQL